MTQVTFKKAADQGVQWAHACLDYLVRQWLVFGLEHLAWTLASKSMTSD